MTFYDAINSCLKKYAVFSGRASRTEFWWFIGAIYFWVHIGVWLEFYAIGRNQVPTAVVIGLVIASPTLAVFWRRFHDIGFTGWIAPLAYAGWFGLAYLYWYFVPDELYSHGFQNILENLAWIAPLLISALPSQSGPNRYGPNPHEVLT